MAPAEATSAPDVVPACVKVIRRAGRSIGSGSGTVVAAEGGRALVLTCRHVLPDGGGDISIQFPDGKEYGALWLGRDAGGADLAAVAITDDGVPHLPVAPAPAGRGEPVYQVGYPGGRGPNRKQGRSLGITGSVQGGRVPVLGASFQSQPGDSGSGVFNAAGELVGVVWGGGGGASCVDHADICRFLASEDCCRLFPSLRRPGVPIGPPPSRPPVGPRVPPPGVNPPPTIPTTPAAGPPGPKGDKGDPGRDADVTPVLTHVEKMQLALEALVKRIALLEERPAPAGPPGPKGDKGDPGRDADVAALRAELDALRRKMNNLGGSIRVKVEPVTPKK